MVKRNYQMPNDDVEQKVFKLPSAGIEHRFQVVEIFTEDDEIGIKLGLNEDTIGVKLEVAEGDEIGRTMVHRVSLDKEWSGFFMTRILLRALSEQYKGEVELDSDSWIGKEFFATVVHNEGKNKKMYANIDFDCELTACPSGKSETKPEHAQKSWDE